MEQFFDESLERPFEPTLDAEYVKALGSLGLYDASLDTYQVKDHPEDDRWIIQSNN